jgi:thioredoxin reductase (NADPH)
MVAALHDLQGRFSFELEVIDVDERPELEARWGEWVPVLLEGDTELCHYRLDPEVLGARLARIE